MNKNLKICLGITIPLASIIILFLISFTIFSRVMRSSKDHLAFKSGSYTSNETKTLSSDNNFKLTYQGLTITIVETEFKNYSSFDNLSVFKDLSKSPTSQQKYYQISLTLTMLDNSQREVNDLIICDNSFRRDFYEVYFTLDNNFYRTRLNFFNNKLNFNSTDCLLKK